MKKLIALVCLLPFAALAQTPARFDQPAVMTTPAQVPVGSLPNLLAVTNATVAICGFPATMSGGMCTNTITTYTDSTLNTACPASSQLTAPGSNQCIPTTGLQGSFGFWYNAAAQVHMTYTVRAKWGTFGPFDILQSGVVAGGSPVAGPAFSINFANSAANLFQADQNFQFNTNLHEPAEKLPVVNALHTDFGVSCMGVAADPKFITDSGCAIQSGINFAIASTFGGQIPQYYLPVGHYKVGSQLSIAGAVNIITDRATVVSKAFNGNLFSVTSSNVSFTGRGTLDGGGFIGAGNITSVTGNGTSATYSYSLTSGLAGVVNNVAVVTGCTTSSSGGFNGIFTLTAGSSGSFTVANTNSVSESESGCTVQFMYGGSVVDAESVSQVNIEGMTIQHGGVNGVLLNNVTNSSVKDSQIIQNGQSGVAVAGTGVEGITISGDTFDCTNATNQDNDCLSFKATPPNTQKAGSTITDNHFTQGAGFSIELQYLGHGIKIANNDCNIVPTPIISAAFPGFGIFSCYSIQDMYSPMEHNTAINLTGIPADFPLIEHFGYKNSVDGNVVVGGDVFLYDVESTFESNHILLGQLVLPNGNETGNPVATGSIVSGNEINTGCAKPGQSWTANTKLQAFYCIADSNGNLEITISDHAAANMTGATQPTWPTAIGTTTIDNNMTWLNIGTPVYGDAGSVATITSVASSGGTAVYSYTLSSGSAPSVGNSAVIVGCTTPSLNGVQTITATATGTFSTANSASVSETESKCRTTFTKGRTAISISCLSSGLSCSETQIIGNQLIDNFSPNGTAISIGAATGALASNVTVRDNNFIGFNSCYSISPASSATSVLYGNREHNCTNLGTINQASHISLEQLIETTQRNFVPNSGFKFGGAGWTINAAYTIYSGNAAEGSGQGLQYVSTGSAPSAVFAISKPITVIPGQKWTVSASIDATAATSGSPVSIAFDRCDAGLGYIQAIQQNGLAGPVSMTGTIPTGVTSGCLVASVGTAVSPSATSFFFSAIQMEPGSLVTPYKENDWSNTDTTIPSAVLPIVPVAKGGTGTATPALVAGTNVTITGTWPNQTINSSGGGSAPTLQTNTVNNASQAALNLLNSSTNAAGLTATFANTSAGNVQLEIAGTINAAHVATLNQSTTSTAANLSGTPALPNGTTATTQTAGDNTTKLATDAFVLANAAGISGLTTGFIPKAASATTINNSHIDDGITTAATVTISEPLIINTGGSVNSTQIGTNLFSALPACAGGTEGTMAPVTDSTTNTWGATITGSGADHVLAYCDGTAWTVAAK
jgi:hypothetical protein